MKLLGKSGSKSYTPQWVSDQAQLPSGHPHSDTRSDHLPAVLHNRLTPTPTSELRFVFLLLDVTVARQDDRSCLTALFTLYNPNLKYTTVTSTPHHTAQP